MTEQPWRFPEGEPSHKSILAALVLARKPPPKKSCRNLAGCAPTRILPRADPGWLPAPTRARRGSHPGPRLKHPDAWRSASRGRADARPDLGEAGCQVTTGAGSQSQALAQRAYPPPSSNAPMSYQSISRSATPSGSPVPIPRSTSTASVLPMTSKSIIRSLTITVP